MVKIIRSLFLGFIVPILITLGFIAQNKNDLAFHTAKLEPIKPELFQKGHHPDQKKYYSINHKFRYLLKLGEPKGKKVATLIWPQEPYTKLIVIVPYHNDQELKAKTYYHGRIKKCTFNCVPPEMSEEFIDTLLELFPDFKEKMDQLPKYIMDTTELPMGLKAYLMTKKYYLGGIAFTYLIGLIIFIRLLLLKK